MLTTIMLRTIKLFSLLAILVLLVSAAWAQEPMKQNKKQTIAPSAGGNPVVGSGTVGQITKWLGSDGSNTFTVGNSNIFEDKFGKVGIGTRTPTSLLTVQGMIETTLGGYKFPDGTIQTTAGISFVTHDASLAGLGTAASPLGIAPGGVQTIHLANSVVTAAKIANGTVVRSFNGLFDNLTLAAGANITITPSGNTLTIAAAGALASVAHDATLTGNGTSGSPLGVAVPLTLQGSGSFVVSASNTGGGDGVRGISTDGIGVSGTSTNAAAVRGISTNNAGVVGESLDFFGVVGGSTNSDGVRGISANSNGVRGTSTSGRGVVGESTSGFGVVGISTDSFGVRGESTNGRGVSGTSANSNGVVGTSTNDSGVVGLTNSANSARAGIVAESALSLTGGVAGIFRGNVRIETTVAQPGNLSVAGTLSKGAGAFKIDHPLDPENKYLYHSFVESPDMMNIYNGVAVLDDRGEAVVELPQWFEALNNKFRYQLTCIGGFAPIYVAEKIADNRFRIAGGQPGMEVSWMVTGIRQDTFAKRNRIPVEEEKLEAERGYYLHPEAFDQPQEKSIQWARDPEGMQQLKKRQLETEQMQRKQPPNQR